MKWHETEMARKLYRLDRFIRQKEREGSLRAQDITQLDNIEASITQPLGILPENANQLGPEHEPTPAILKLIIEAKQEKLLQLHPDWANSLSCWINKTEPTPGR